MVKHYAAYSNPEQGLNTGPVHGGERELRTTYVWEIPCEMNCINLIADGFPLTSVRLLMVAHGLS